MQALALMPFDPGFEDVFASMKRACEHCKIECERVDQQHQSLDVVDQIVNSIRCAAICIADCTGNNRNVLWELGFAMALEKPVILVTQKRADIGFDLRNFRNVEYQRANLASTLEKELVAGLETIKAKLPELVARPHHSAHAQSFAMSAAMPLYFLSQDYTIEYMNEAAIEFFSLEERDDAQVSWVGRPLREFVNAIAHNVENMPDVERNLQLQTERIRELEKSGRSEDIMPYNIETVVFNSSRYGKITLQKVGIAVRDHTSGSVTGWVVSFNVARVAEPDRFSDFFVRHRQMVKGRLFNSPKEHPRPAPPDYDQELRDPAVAAWAAATQSMPHIDVAGDYAQKQASFEFSSQIMKTKRYGLRSVSYLDDWIFDYGASDYLVVKMSDGGNLVATFRMSLQHDMRVYQNLAPWLRVLIDKNCLFADCGAYIHPGITDLNRWRMLAWLTGQACRRLHDVHQHTYLYAQVPTHTVSRLYTAGFRNGGHVFTCQGWDHEWCPIVLKCSFYADGANSGPGAEAPDSTWPLECKASLDPQFAHEARVGAAVPAYAW